MLKISVVTPCLNQVRTIEKTLRSVLEQEWVNVEYVVVDGGSTDGTWEIVQRHADRIHHCSSEPDRGQYWALNEGFRHTTGDVLAWLNGDDFYLPGALRAVAEIFSQLSEVHWLTTLSPMLADANGVILTCARLPGVSRQAFLDGLYLPGPLRLGVIQQESTFWRRSVWERCGPLNTNFELAADYALWCQFVASGTNFYCTQCPLGCFRFWSGQKSQACEERYWEEARRSHQGLQRQLGWRPDRWKQLSLSLHRYSSLQFLPSYLFRELNARVHYEAHQVVRRQRGSEGAIWQVRNFDFVAWPITDDTPHFAN